MISLTFILIIDPLTWMLIAAIAQVVVGGAGAALNYSNAQKTNRMNKQIQDEINLQNYNIFQETKQYNSPQNQVDLLRKAGINPITAFGNLSSTSKITPVEMDSAKMQAPSIDANQLASVIGNSLNMFTSQKKTEQEIIGLQTENLTKAQQIKAEIDNKIADTKVKDSQVYTNTENILMQKQRLELEKSSVAVDNELTLMQIRQTAADTGNKLLQQQALNIQNKIAKIDLQYKDAKSYQELQKVMNENSKLLQEIENLKSTEKNIELKNALTALQLNLQVQTFDTTKKLLEAQTFNAQAQPWFQGANLATDILGTALKRPSNKNTTYNNTYNQSEFNKYTE